jgi:hypothetical protein
MVMGGAILCMAAAAPCVAGEAVVSGGGLICAAPLYPFGNLGPEQMVQHTFVLTNASDRVVQIGNVRLGCGCLTSTLATNCVLPGGTTELTAVMSLAGRKGYQRKPIYVESDGGPGVPLKLEFEGNVVPPIEVLPEGIHFGAQAVEGDLDRDVMVVAMGKSSFQIKKVKSSSPQFSAEVETVEAGKRYRLKVKCKGPRSFGTCTASVHVETDHPAMPGLDVPVTVFVTGDIVAAPATLILIEAATNTPRPYYVHVYSPGKKAFKIEKVTAPREDIETRVTAIAPDRYRVELSVPGKVEELNGKPLRIETDMASMKEVVVPLRVIIRQPK